jgi:hypothetical protein
VRYLDLFHDTNYSVFAASLLKSEGLDFFAVHTLDSSEFVIQAGCRLGEFCLGKNRAEDGISHHSLTFRSRYVCIKTMI